MRFGRTVILTAVLVLLGLIHCTDGFSAIYNVSNTAQFRQALENAAVNGQDDTIILAAGTYKTTDDGLGTFSFVDTEPHSLTIRAADGLTSNDVILDGANTHQVLNYKNSMVSTLTLDRLSIKNGKAASSKSGGGIAINLDLHVAGNVIVGGCVISGNSAGRAGGIYGNGTVTVTDSTISNNSATAFGGGGIAGDGTVTVNNSTISGNPGGGVSGFTTTITNSTVSGNSGGGVSGVSTVTVTGSTITDNSKDIGGGIAGGTVTVNNSTISNNSAYYCTGGGISGNAVTVTNSTVSGNSASCTGYAVWGGGIYSYDTVTVINSTISGNSALNGGGGGISGNAVTVTNSMVSGNSVGMYGSGGGIDGGTVTVNNSTISGNDSGIAGDAVTVNNSTISGNGGGMSGFSVIVTNSIISGNSTGISSGYYGILTVINSTISGNSSAAPYGGGIFGSGLFVNNIFSNNSSDISFTGPSDVWNNYIDYSKLINETGAWYTVTKENNIQPSAGSLNFVDASFRLGPGSAAIDIGLDPSSANFGNLFTDPIVLQTVRNALTTDKDGYPRIVGSAIDLGAYEYSNCTLSISPDGTGLGTIIGHPGTIYCGSGNTDCFSYFPTATIVSLETIPAIGGSIFSGWGGDADCSDGQVTVDKAVNCTATFTLCQASAAQIGSTQYGSIWSAYEAASLPPNDIIQLIASNQQETLDFDGGTTVTLDGGYDCAFTPPSLLMTTITGSVTVSSGTVIFNNIRIQ